MSNSLRTNQELLQENSALKQKIRELEQSAALQKQVEEELRYSWQQLRLLIDAGPDFFFLKDLQFRYQLVNSANARFFGCDETAILGLTDFELMPEEAALACRESDEQAIRDRALVITIEPVGDRFYETHKFPLLVDGEVVGVAGIVRDITGHRQAEEALRKSEELQATILNHVGAHIFLKDKQHRYTYVNNNVCELFGMKVDEIIGKDDTNFFSAASIEEIRKSDRRVIEYGETITREEIDLTSADKVPHSYWVVKMPLKDSNGTIYGLCGISTDITELKRAGEAMKLNAERTEILLQLNQMSMASLQEIMDFALEKAVQMTRSTIGYLAFTNEDESVLTIHSWSRTAMRECAISQKPVHFPMVSTGLWGEAVRQRKPIITNDYSLPDPCKKGYPEGHVPIFRHMNIPVFSESHIVLVAGVGNKADDYNETDVQQLTLLMEGIWRIIERKKAEEELKSSQSRLASIIEFLPDATFAIDLEGKVISWNRALEELTGYAGKEMLGRGNYEYAIPFYGERRPLFVDLLLSWDDEIARKYSFIKKEGDTVYAEGEVPFVRRPSRMMWGKASLLRNERGEVIGAIETMRDVTDRKFLESQLFQAQKMEAIGTLAGGVAHDFNNILMGIEGYVSLMLQEIDPYHPHHERLKYIEEQVHSASDLTRQLLGFARVGRYEIQPTDLNQLIRKSSSMFSRTKKELTITRKYEKNLWTVEVDRGQIEQVLLNLYVNAWHAMPAGGKISLETKNLTLEESFTTLHAVPPGKYVMVRVSDTGTGMNEETRERIFDPFFTTKKMGRGTGLGLAIVYGIIRGHGGFISVESEPGRGTAFTIYLPASEKEVLQEKTTEAETLRGTETILIVDDEPTILAVSKAMLEFLGYTVHEATSGPEAIALYREKKGDIDLVILDMIMPELSGGETFDRIRGLNPSAKVMLSSGYSLDGQAQQIMNRGCRGFIQKPFNIDSLSRKVREVLGK
ncbi:PAS domain S-box-containing protein [Syntrophus gentianae]|uniref:histidine kinase n=1 Tax=Syntrophus gentianae TaxID=43775 RepID=A0A1H7W3G7_9BACT|nr:PAS domain-containing protein [Syntrophus gentianae]SEM16040.1 PAS domain S-box-containing protein [Syntrophus gentianae]